MKKVRIHIAILALCSLCFFVGRVSKRGCEVDFTTKYDTITIFKTDTCIVHDFDTIVENVVRYKQIAVHDTAFVFDDDTIKIPITQKHYHEDSLCDIWVSGYEPNLDSANIIQRERTIIERHYIDCNRYSNCIGVQANNVSAAMYYSRNIGKRWQVGVQVGSSYECSPQIGIGLGVRF